MSATGTLFSAFTFTDIFSNWGYLIPFLLLLIIVAQVVLLFVVTCMRKITSAFSLLFFLIVAALVLCLAGNFALVQDETAPSQSVQKSVNSGTEKVKGFFHQTGFQENSALNGKSTETKANLSSSDQARLVPVLPSERDPSRDRQATCNFKNSGHPDKTGIRSTSQEQTGLVRQKSNEFVIDGSEKAVRFLGVSDSGSTGAIPYEPGEIQRSNADPSNSRTTEYTQPPYSTNTVPGGVSQPSYNGQINSTSEGRQVGFSGTIPSIGEHQPLTPVVKEKIANLGPLEFNKLAQKSDDAKRRAIFLSRAATVRIEAKVYRDKKNPKSRVTEETGSGILFERKGRVFILTNYHVAGQAVGNSSIDIIFRDNQVLHPVSVYPCREVDIALLELNRNKFSERTFTVPSGDISDADVYAAQFGDSGKVREMDEVWSIGSPFGLTGTISKGVISARDRRDIQLGVPEQIQGFLQTDAAINPGNSGGPLVNVQGEIIAVVTAIASRNGNGSGIAFAIPINTALKVVDQFIETGEWKRGYLGLDFDSEYTNSERMQDGLTEAIGARITNVSPGSPAESCGFHSNDIIISYDGILIRDAEQLRQLIGLSSPGHKPKIVLMRGGQKYGTEPELIGNSAYAANE